MSGGEEIVKLVGGLIAIIGGLLAAGIFIGRTMFGAGGASATIKAEIQALATAVQTGIASLTAQMSEKFAGLSTRLSQLEERREDEATRRAEEAVRDAERLAKLETTVRSLEEDVRSVREDRHKLATKVANVYGWWELQERKRESGR